MPDISNIGNDWILSEIDGLTESISYLKPSEFNERHRYLPESVSPMPGFIRYDVNPFMREIIDCFDINSPVREISVKKGVQITYTTMLESVLLYFMAHVKTLPIMFMTADKELAESRIENNIIPMINQSGFDHIIRSSDEGNSRKTGKTKHHIQWEGGGFLLPFGAKNADKMRMHSIAVMLKDELDAWPYTVGKDGDPDALSDDRCSAYWERRKIGRGGTPSTLPSKIDAAYKRGDQRKYMVLCKACSFPQYLRWSSVNKETGIIGGFDWDLDDGMLIVESVRYRCQECGHAHQEHDKERLFSPDHGAHWKPTARPVEQGIRSYHLPALYSPIGMQPWYKSVGMYLKGWDPVAEKVRDISLYQVFYNNVLAEPFQIMGSKITFTQVSAHRRAVYRLGQIPNQYATQFSGSPVLMLTCTVDVHKRNLAVAVMGWCRDMRCYLIDYWRFEAKENENDCDELDCSVWGRLRALIEEKEYEADDGKKYKIAETFIDAGYANDTVTTFCSVYASGVHPILGRDRAAKNQTIKEFAEFTTQAGRRGYRILVDHYKDRLGPVLRREWVEEAGEQGTYHFNAPVDTSDKQLKELTVETRKEKTDPKGGVTYFWHRPGNARNELWDLLVYAHAAVEVAAWNICVGHFELETVDWPRFWDFIESEKLYYTD